MEDQIAEFGPTITKSQANAPASNNAYAAFFEKDDINIPVKRSMTHMAKDDLDKNRARMAIEGDIRRINRDVIHGIIPDLTLADLEPFFRLVAEARGTYIKHLLDLTKHLKKPLDDSEVRELGLRRRAYDELIHGAQAMETAIERGYIDFKRGAVKD